MIANRYNPFSYMAAFPASRVSRHALLIDRAMQLPQKELVVISPMHESTDRRAAQMLAVADVPATLFEFWVKAK